MLPIGDERRIKRVPIITSILLVIMTVIFLWQQRLDHFADSQLILAFGLNPAHLFGYRTPPPYLSYIPPSATLLTYAFLHGGWWHLLGNGLFLWVFGPAVEDATGPVNFSGLFLIAAAVSGITQSIPLYESQAQLIGASGAISGLIGAYLILFPKAKLVVLIPLIFIVFNSFRCPSVLFIGVWFLIQIGAALLFSSTAGNVAILAHIGGFICGLVVVPFLRRSEIPLFGGK